MLVLVYITGVIVFSNLQLLSRSQAVSASDLTGPTLPVVCIDVNGSKVNRMNGYLMEMERCSYHEAVEMLAERAHMPLPEMKSLLLLSGRQIFMLSSTAR